jgi:hypothetical protein
MFPWNQSAKYTQVAEFEVEKETEPSRKESRKVHAVWYVLCILSALLLGFVAGKYMTLSPSEDYIGMIVISILQPFPCVEQRQHLTMASNRYGI